MTSDVCPGPGVVAFCTMSLFSLHWKGRCLRMTFYSVPVHSKEIVSQGREQETLFPGLMSPHSSNHLVFTCGTDACSSLPTFGATQTPSISNTKDKTFSTVGKLWNGRILQSKTHKKQKIPLPLTENYN